MSVCSVVDSVAETDKVVLAVMASVVVPGVVLVVFAVLVVVGVVELEVVLEAVVEDVRIGGAVCGVAGGISRVTCSVVAAVSIRETSDSPLLAFSVAVAGVVVSSGGGGSAAPSPLVSGGTKSEVELFPGASATATVT